MLHTTPTHCQLDRLHQSGESYAGHFIPALSHRIFEGNRKEEGQHINLRGIAIGNGLVDPEQQYTEYPRYAWDHHLVNPEMHGLMEVALPACLALIKSCKQNSTIGWSKHPTHQKPTPSPVHKLIHTNRCMLQRLH